MLKHFTVLFLILLLIAQVQLGLCDDPTHIEVFFLEGVERDVDTEEEIAVVTSEDVEDFMDNYSVEEILTEYPDFDTDDVDIISAVGAELKGFNFGKVFNVPIPEGEDYEDMVTDLQGLDEVGYANAVFPPIPGTWPNDDHYPQPSQENDVNNWVTIQANLHSTTYTMANHSCMDINMQPAFDEYQGSPEIVWESLIQV
jgi:hypothetical protein